VILDFFLVTLTFRITDKRIEINYSLIDLKRGTMPRLSNIEKVNSNSFESADNRSLTSEVPQIHKEENGVPFFDGKFSIRTANQLVLRQEAYKLLYDVYSKVGIAQDRSTDLWLSIFDALPETTTLVAQDHKGEIQGAITLVFDSPIGLPADELYNEEIDELRNTGREIIELISFGVKETARGSIKILAILFYSAYLLSWRKKKATDFVVTVDAHHEKFYCRAIKFKKIGAVRNYVKVNGNPTVLLNLPLKLPDILRNKVRVFPRPMLNYSEREELDIAEKIQDMHRPMSDEEFYTFFIDKTNVWEKATSAQKEYLKNISDGRKADHFSISRALAKGISRKLQDNEAVYQNPEAKTIKSQTLLDKIAKSQ